MGSIAHFNHLRKVWTLNREPIAYLSNILDPPLEPWALEQGEQTPTFGMGEQAIVHALPKFCASALQSVELT